ACASGSSAASPFSSSTSSDPSGRLTKSDFRARDIRRLGRDDGVPAPGARIAGKGGVVEERCATEQGRALVARLRVERLGLEAPGRNRPESRLAHELLVQRLLAAEEPHALLRLDQPVAALAAAIHDVDLV